MLLVDAVAKSCVFGKEWKGLTVGEAFRIACVIQLFLMVWVGAALRGHRFLNESSGWGD